MEKMIKPYLTRDFACMLHSEKEIEQLNKKEFKSSCMFVLASTIIGPGKIKMTGPTLRAIFDIFISVRIRVIQKGEITERQFVKLLNDSIIKVLKYLEIPQDIFIQGSYNP